MKHIEMVFSLLLTASLASTAILLLLVFIRKLFKKHLNPKVVYMLWLLVLIKLLVPVTPQSAVSVFNLLPPAGSAEWNSESNNLIANRSSESYPYTSLHNGEDKTLATKVVPNEMEQPASVTDTPPSQDETFTNQQEGFHWLAIGSIVWLAGVVCLIGYYCFSALLFEKRIQSSRKLVDEEVLLISKTCKEKLGITKSIAIYETSRLCSPCLYGVFKPAIYLPEDITAVADSGQLTHILLHELTHYKRKDLWNNSFWMLSVALHWYNPFAWWAFKKMKSDQEVACDAAVLEVLDERDSSSYGMTLLMLSRLFSRGNSTQVNLSPFFKSKSEMRRRITMISNFKKGSYKLSALAIVLFVTLSAVLLTSAADSEKALTSDVTAQATHSNGDIPSTYRDVFGISTNSLDRALDFKKFKFKVPDYIPDTYQLEYVEVNKHPFHPYDNFFLDVVAIQFNSPLSPPDPNYWHKAIEVMASRGDGNMLKSNRLWGAPQGEALAPEYQQRAVTIGSIKGTIFTSTEEHTPKTKKSFVWEDSNIWYAINYYNDDISEKELTKMVQSYVFPQQVQHVKYDGEGNSFPLYDQKDVLAAKHILDIKLKLPIKLNHIDFHWNNTYLMQAGPQNYPVMEPFEHSADTLFTRLHSLRDSTIYDKDAGLDFFQSKVPLFDTSKLSLTGIVDINGIKVSAYADNNQVYYEPTVAEDEKTKLSLTYYVWEQDNTHFTAVFHGLDTNQEKHLETLVLTPLQ